MFLQGERKEQGPRKGEQHLELAKKEYKLQKCIHLHLYNFYQEGRQPLLGDTTSDVCAF